MTAHPVYLFYTKNQVTETLRAPLYKEGPPCVPFIIRKKKQTTAHRFAFVYSAR